MWDGLSVCLRCCVRACLSAHARRPQGSTRPSELGCWGSGRGGDGAHTCSHALAHKNERHEHFPNHSRTRTYASACTRTYTCTHAHALIQDAFEKKHGTKLGFMSIFLKASASALQAFPDANAYIDGATNEIVYRNYVDIRYLPPSPLASDFFASVFVVIHVSFASRRAFFLPHVTAPALMRSLSFLFPSSSSVGLLRFVMCAPARSRSCSCSLMLFVAFFFAFSVAVGTPTGLVVPVVRNVERMSFADVEKTIAIYGQRARSNQVRGVACARRDVT